jgi:hypothetical protein
MKCINCLSRDAHLRGIHGWQWLWSPLFVEIHCERCLHDFYFPTIAWGIGRIKELTDDGAMPDDGEDDEPLRMSSTKPEPVDLNDLKLQPEAKKPPPLRDSNQDTSTS